jgi:hypothetical protein
MCSGAQVRTQGEKTAMSVLKSRRSSDQVRLGQIALNAGQPAHARRLSLIALDALRGPGCDPHARAMALLVMAQADVMASRMGHAFSLGTQALQCFEAHQDLEHCAEALGVTSYSAASLGRTGVSLEMANRCIDLRAPLSSTRIHALGGNYLGVASFWSGDFHTAADALDSTLEALHDSATPHECFQPLVNRCFTDMLDITHARLERRDADLAPFLRRLSGPWKMALGGTVSALSKGSTAFGTTILVFLKAQAELLSGHLEDAEPYIEACGARAQQLPDSSWLRALKPWLDHDLARAAGDRRKAALGARAMLRAAQVGEHHVVAELAQRLLSSCREGSAGT